MEDTWFSRDLPVLEAIVKLSEENPWVRAEAIERVTGFESATVDKALQALRYSSPPVFMKTSGSHDRRIGSVNGVTGYARQLVGQWPTPETVAERIIGELEKRAVNEPDEEKRGRLKKVASWISEGGRDLFVDITAAVIKQQTGMD